MQLERRFQQLRGIFRQKKLTPASPPSNTAQGAISHVSTKFGKDALASGAISTSPTGNGVVVGTTTPASKFSFDLPVCSHPARILVADDNLLIRTSLINLMEQWRLPYTAAANGLAAWKALQSEDFNLVIIDLQMPGMDGHEVINKLRASRRNSNRKIPIVVLAGNDTPSIRKQMRQVGINDFLTKPFDPKALYKVITKYLSVSPAQQTKMYVDGIDQRRLQQLYSNDYEHLNEMFQIFLRNTPVAIQAMDKAMRAKDWRALEREVHKVKPTFAMVGLQKITQMAGNLEITIRQSRQLNRQLKQEFSQFKRTVGEAIKAVNAQKKAIRPHLK